MSELKVIGGRKTPERPRTDDLRIVRSRGVYERRFKRPLDVVGASALLVVFAPLMGVLALAIRLRLGKGVLFTQERVGDDQIPFTIYKFRTMQHDRRRRHVDVPNLADRRNGHKKENDPRHTGLGRALRRLSLDELPQLFNVLRGEMSLVGPRPEVVDVARERGYLEHPRHDVKPGMTGPYQVSALRENGDLRDGLEMDVEYVNGLSFRTDVKYLVATLQMVLNRGTGS